MLTLKKGGPRLPLRSLPGCFLYPPNSRPQKPRERSASSSRRSSSTLSRSASARRRSSSTRARSRSKSPRAVLSACAVSSRRPSRRPSSLWRSSCAPPGACPGPLRRFSRGSWACGGRSLPALSSPDRRGVPVRVDAPGVGPSRLAGVPALVLALEVPGPQELADPSGRPVQDLRGLLEGVEFSGVRFHPGSCTPIRPARAR